MVVVVGGSGGSSRGEGVEWLFLEATFLTNSEAGWSFAES